ncbi:MAG: hypothetical protein ACLGH0_04265 [Thermoanaerobaculia bacterium]
MLPCRRFPVFLVFLALPLFAQPHPIQLDPANPSSDTPITFIIPSDCPLHATVTRNGALIRISVNHSVCDPPLFSPHYVQYPGTLPPGQYRVEAVSDGGTFVHAVADFVVRDRNDDPFTVHSSAAPIDGSLWVQLAPKANTPLCPNSDCTVRFGGTVATEKRAMNDGKLWVKAPAHAVGWVDVTIERGGVTQTAPASLYYFDRGQEATHAAAFERVLFPILANLRGGKGSDWRTDAVISNPTNWFIETYYNIRPIVCPTFPCGERLAPGEYAKFTGGDFPHGVALLVPRREAPFLSFSSRVRDVSREAETFGTELPVVREHELFRDKPVRLLDIPVDSRYRVKLRVYGLPFNSLQPYLGNLTVTNPATGAKRVETFFLDPTCRQDCTVEPSYLEIDLPPGAQNERVNVEIQLEEGLAWAFASITNNETQQVTIVAPNGGAQ